MPKEGNIISFKVFVDSKGLLMTEYSKVPNDKINKIFTSEDASYIEKILAKVDPQFRNMHKELEKELEGLN